MKFLPITAIFGILFFVLLFAGCTSPSPPVRTQTSVPTNAVVVLSPTPAVIPVAAPYPSALAMNEYSTYGTGDKQGRATVYRYEVKPTYNWTSPSWKSAHEQAATQPFELQRGYNTEKPKEGNTFLFVHVQVQNTGDTAVYAPSAKQFIVFSDGKMYNYTSVESSDVVIDTVSGKQYDYQIGQGGTVGYIQPGESNTADGYLIYEIPAGFSPDRTYVVSTLDYQNQAVWKLG